MPMLPYHLDYSDYSAIYNALSFVMASMMASTVFFFFQAQGVKPQFKTALYVSGLVTLIAFYHYFRIFDSFVAAYKFPKVDENTTKYSPHASGIPFNDAYRYMDWLLTVPLLLIEPIMVMSLDEKTTASLSKKLGTAAALMIVLGYPGEISDLTKGHGMRWTFWVLACLPFAYIVYTLFVGLKTAVANQPEEARSLVSQARYVTIISWLTYPIVYIIPLLGNPSPADSLVGIQIGYSISDFISKCVVGFMVTRIAMIKSASAKDGDVPLLRGVQAY